MSPRTSTLTVAMLALAACARRDAATDSSHPVTPMTTTSGAVATAAGTFSLASTAFNNGGSIPAQYTCDGANHSPPLAWSSAPPRTAALALIVEDPDAPGGTFIHWVLYDIPGATTSLPENLPRGAVVQQLGGAKQGATSAGGSVGYMGPCPPRGPAHHYHFRLFALDAKLGLPAGATRDQVVAAMRGHELGHAELVGLYARGGR